MDKITNNLAEIRIRDRETLAQDTDNWKQVCVVVMGLLES